MFPACILQPHARQAILCPTDQPGQVLNLTDCHRARAPPDLQERQLGAAASSFPLPPPPPSSPPPTSSTGTCSRQTSKAKARCRSPRTMARSFSGRWLTNAADMAGREAGAEGVGCATAGPEHLSLPHTKYPGLHRPVNTQTMVHTVHASTSIPVQIHFQIPRAGSLL